MSNPEFTAPDYTSQDAATYKANLDASIAANGSDYVNLGFSYDVGTGVFTIHGAEGTALSSSNPAFVRFQDPDNFGYNKYISIEANQSFIDDNGSSEIIGNLFGYPTGTAVSSDVRFYLYAVPNDGMDTVQFMIARMSHHDTSPAAASIGAPDDAVADTVGSFFSLDNLDETAYDSNPCTCVGSFRMQMSSLDDWTVQTLDSSDGIGKNCDKNNFIPRAKARLSSNASNVTGDSTDYTVAFDVEDIDTSLLDVTTGYFTAPRDGMYVVQTNLRIAGLSSSHTEGIMGIISSNKSNADRFHPYNMSTGTSYTSKGSALVDMEAGDTVYITLNIKNGTKVVDVQGSASDDRSVFGIHWIGEL